MYLKKIFAKSQSRTLGKMLCLKCSIKYASSMYCIPKLIASSPALLPSVDANQHRHKSAKTPAKDRTN